MNDGNQGFQSNAKGLSIACLVLGIAAVVLAWFNYSNVVALACGIAGIICAQKAKIAGDNSGRTTAGFILSIIGAALAGITIVACIACAGIIASLLI